MGTSFIQPPVESKRPPSPVQREASPARSVFIYNIIIIDRNLKPSASIGFLALGGDE